MQRGRHNHLTESVPMFMSVLSQISKPHGLQATSCTRAAEFAAADAAAADTMLTETITAYLDWQVKRDAEGHYSSILVLGYKLGGK